MTVGELIERLKNVDPSMRVLGAGPVLDEVTTITVRAVAQDPTYGYFVVCHENDKQYSALLLES